MSGTSEEKSLPASDKKLRDARGTGQVAKSKDMVTGIALLAGTVYLVWALDGLRDRIEAFFLMVARRATTEPFERISPVIRQEALQLLLALAVPLLAVTLAAIILANVAGMKGVVFSVTPVAPDFKRIDPGEGLKRIFSMRGVIEVVKAVVKIVALGTAFWLVLRAQLPALMRASTCGVSCQMATFQAMARPLVATALIAFLVVGFADHFIQKWLFGRDMKMTKSEAKRERKDMEGDPTILRQRKEERQSLQTQSGRTGLSRATIVVGAPGVWTVGVRYVRGETPVPVVVSRAGPEEAEAMLAQAAAAGIAVCRDDALSAMIARASRTGQAVPQRSFQLLADLLVAAGRI